MLISGKKEPIYINPYTDFGFKKLFGEEANKDLLIDFLNVLLPKKHRIKELNFRNVENSGDFADERKAIFDIHCEAENGERFIVEMQKAKVEHFKDRAVFYTTYPIREQSKKGEWNFRLSAIYFIAILDFFYDEDKENAIVWRKVMLKDQYGKAFFKKLQYHFLQMPAFKQKPKPLNTHFDKWLYFLSHLEDFDEIPQILNEPVFQKGFETARIANLNNLDFDKYEQSRLQYLEIKESVNSALKEGMQKGILEGIQLGIQEGIQKGLEEGIQKGLEEGIQKGLEEGLEKGKQEGMIEGKIKIAKNCLQKGLSIEQTIEICDLPLEMVQKIAKEMGIEK